ncbi:hypothetical protein HY612_03630 [Candidatus Roizmanbacteria bacterium]|nr:hypothetical protein [Candidatus Roizmanbacteria bacterium]
MKCYLMKLASDMSNNWLTPKLKRKVIKVFEPRYKRKFADDEIREIAENLTDFMEIYLKFKWRQKNNNK